MKDNFPLSLHCLYLYIPAVVSHQVHKFLFSIQIKYKYFHAHEVSRFPFIVCLPLFPLHFTIHPFEAKKSPVVFILSNLIFQELEARPKIERSQAKLLLTLSGKKAYGMFHSFYSTSSSSSSPCSTLLSFIFYIP